MVWDKNIVVLSTGEMIPNPRHLRKQEKETETLATDSFPLGAAWEEPEEGPAKSGLAS